jgi:2-polyprenyl-3-methyl-5-hydroxy-6-metoxy-1,4-benzoquinol methylase
MSFTPKKALFLGTVACGVAVNDVQSFIIKALQNPLASMRIHQRTGKRHQIWGMVNGGEVEVEQSTGEKGRSVFSLLLNDDAEAELRRRLVAQQKTNTTSPEESELIQVEGYLTSKRGFGSSFCFFDLSRRGVRVPVQAMLKRQAFLDRHKFEGFMKCLVPGIRLRVTGPVIPNRNPGEALVLIQEIHVQRLPHNPQHVRKLLKLVNDGLLGVQDISSAAKKTDEDLSHSIGKEKEKWSPAHPRAFNGLAKKLLNDLKVDNENDFEYPEFTSDHKLTHSMPAAPDSIQFPPSSLKGSMAAVECLGMDNMTHQSVLSTIQTYERDGTLNERAAQESVSVVGWVQNRRRFRNNIIQLELVDQMISAEPDNMSPELDIKPVQHSITSTGGEVEGSFRSKRLISIIHPNVLSMDSGGKKSERFGQILAPGSKVIVQGHILSQTSDIEPASVNVASSTATQILWIDTVHLLVSSWRPIVVSFLIEQVKDRQFGTEEASRALKVSRQELNRIIAMDDVTKRHWESAEISRRLQRQAMEVSMNWDPAALKILDEFDNLRAQYPIQFVDSPSPEVTGADSFVSTRDSRWRRKKQPQLEWLAQQVENVLQESYPDRFCKDNTQKGQLRILDVGGGKGFLANHLARRLLAMGFDVKLLVVDLADVAVHNGRICTERQQLSGAVKYLVADASTVDLTAYGRFDLVVALHACGGLTDVALGHAVNQQTPFVICPCCFCSNPQLFIPRSKQNENTGTKRPPLSIGQWLKIGCQEYQSLKITAELQSDLNLANRAIHSICAVRLSAVAQHATIELDVSIKTFPIAYSTRNFCLVGELVRDMAPNGLTSDLKHDE